MDKKQVKTLDVLNDRLQRGRDALFRNASSDEHVKVEGEEDANGCDRKS
jgi:hypothetical protein